MDTNCTNLLFRDIYVYVSTLGYFPAHGSCTNACICQSDHLPALSHMEQTFLEKKLKNVALLCKIVEKVEFSTKCLDALYAFQ